jgi:hypothetical protein
MGQIVCRNCGHPPHPGVAFCVEMECNTGLPCECVDFVPVDEEETTSSKSLFDLAKEFTEQSGYKFTALYELPDAPPGRKPGWLSTLMEEHGKVVDLDDVLGYVIRPSGIIVLFVPLSGNVIVYEMSEWFSDRFENLAKDSALFGQLILQ